MTDGPHVYHRIARQIKQYLPNLSRRRFENLTWLMTGIHLSRHVHLSKIAAWRRGRATLPSKIRQLRRFLANERIGPWPLYRPLARLLLEMASRHGTIHLLIDRLELSGPRTILMVAQAYRRRMWIEQLFADLEGEGFQLQRSCLYKPDRLSRLLLPLCWVYVWPVHVGAWVIKRGQRPMVDRNDRRDRSLVEIGRYWTGLRLARRKPFRMGSATSLLVKVSGDQIGSALRSSTRTFLLSNCCNI